MENFGLHDLAVKHSNTKLRRECRAFVADHLFFSKRSQTFPVGDAVAVLSKVQLETD